MSVWMGGDGDYGQSQGFRKNGEQGELEETIFGILKFSAAMFVLRGYELAEKNKSPISIRVHMK